VFNDPCFSFSKTASLVIELFLIQIENFLQNTLLTL